MTIAASPEVHDAIVAYLLHAIRNAAKARDWNAIGVLVDDLQEEIG